MKVKSLFKNIALLLFSVIFTLICFEIFFSWFHNVKFKLVWQTDGVIHKLDKDFIYSLIPNSRGSKPVIEKGFVDNAIINSFGLRDREITDSSSYSKRIIILGDSFTYGHGVSNEKTYPNFLETFFLVHQGKKIDVINAGVQGYGTDQEYKFYKKRLYKLKHDFLILSLNFNDIDDNINFPLFTIKDDALEPLDAKKNWLYFLTNIYLKSPNMIQKSSIFNFVLTRLKNRDLFFLLPKMTNEELREWSKRKIMLEIEALQAITKRRGITLIIVTMPIKNSPSVPYDWIKGFLNKKNILFLDVGKEPEWKERVKKLFFIKDPHLTADGNFWMAWRVFQGMKDFIEKG